MWRLTQKQIEEWLEKNELKFVAKENINPNCHAKRWLQNYIHSDLHEIFFVEFPIILTEWLIRLCEDNPTWRDDGPREWTPELVQHLKEINNHISYVVDFWLDSSLKGYITKFFIDYTKSYSTTEREFFQGPRTKYLKELRVWINMALHDGGTLPMKNDN